MVVSAKISSPRSASSANSTCGAHRTAVSGWGLRLAFSLNSGWKNSGKNAYLGKSSTLEIMVALFSACAARKVPNSLRARAAKMM